MNRYALPLQVSVRAALAMGLCLIAKAAPCRPSPMSLWERFQMCRVNQSVFIDEQCRRNLNYPNKQGSAALLGDC
jgi:hypothetical protein